MCGAFRPGFAKVQVNASVRNGTVGLAEHRPEPKGENKQEPDQV